MKRELAPSPARRDPAVDEALEGLARWMDDAFRIPVIGARFGLDALLGLVPGFGDTATSLVAFYVLIAAVRRRVPKVTVARMGLNIAIDYLVGALPFVGDAFDLWWKANRRNLELLRRHAPSPQAPARGSTFGDWIFVGAIIAGLVMLLVGSLVVAAFLAGALWRWLRGA
ncbi:MAG: DUF4112 domain-containing protein [Polyangiaceae bacterium]|jgi:hypothetical protein|nr:DUF4112 domain-containing protein [Polyangiaceae bacterium]